MGAPIDALPGGDGAGSNETPVPPRRGLTSLAARNALAAVSGRVATLLIGLVLTPFVLSRLGQDLYGVLTTTGSAFQYLILLRGGLGSAMRRHVTIRVHTGRAEEAKRHYAAGFWWGMILLGPILIAGLLLAEPLCRFIGLAEPLIPDAARGVALLMVAAVIGDAANILEVPAYATGNVAIISVVRAVVTLVRLPLVLLAFHLLLPTLSLYGWAQIVAELLLFLALWMVAQRSRAAGPAIPRPSLGDAPMRREIFSYGGLALVGTAASLLWVTTDNLLIGRFYGPAAVTFYSLGARWMPLVRGFVMSMTSSLTPLFTQLEAKADPSRTRAATVRAVAVTSAMAVPFCLVPCVVGDLFLATWVGEEYRGASVILIATLAPLVIDIGLSPVWAVLLARGRIGWVSTGDLIVALGNVAVSLVLALPLGMGLLGFALGNTVALLGRNLLLRPLIAARDSSIPPMGQLFVPIGRALAGGAPALVLLYLSRDLYGSSLGGVAIAGMAAGAICFAGASLAAIGWTGMLDLLRAVRARGGKRR